eukprot:12894389-Alexandrium_andersonii.AAC.1
MASTLMRQTRPRMHTWPRNGASSAKTTPCTTVRSTRIGTGSLAQSQSSLTMTRLSLIHI